MEKSETENTKEGRESISLDQYLVTNPSVFYTRAVEANNIEEATRWYELYRKAADYEVKLNMKKNQTRNKICFTILSFSILILLSTTFGLSSLIRKKMDIGVTDPKCQNINNYDNFLIAIASFGIGGTLIIFAPNLAPILLKTLNIVERIELKIKPEEGENNA